jgi:hypothetical protein
MKSVNTTTLYRPTGPKEFELVKESGFSKWPPRLPEQPYFYPVTNEKYAENITRKWNVKEYGSGYVLKFYINTEFIKKYEIQTVGADYHKEWWISAGDLSELNENILGKIMVVAKWLD